MVLPSSIALEDSVLRSQWCLLHHSIVSFLQMQTNVHVLLLPHAVLHASVPGSSQLVSLVS